MKALAEWPLEQRRGICGVFTDIDDTLTTEGAITPDALEALHALRRAGVTVVPITGRPIGWCTPFLQGASNWPVDAMVAENGAVAYVRSFPSQNGLQPAQNMPDALSKIYQQDSATRSANRAAMQQVAQRVRREVPGVELSRDSVGRETDLAFDYAEHTQLPAATVEQVLAVLRDSGMQTTVSSIHIHGCFGDFNKWQGACWLVRTLWGRELTDELDRWVFVGDSGNDQPMFAHFSHSVGVANIARFVPHLQHLPRYVAPSARGAGFAELAQAILEARPA